MIEYRQTRPMTMSTLGGIWTKIDYMLYGRVYEWWRSLAMIELALEIFGWRDVLKASAFQWLLLIMSTAFVGWFMLILGMLCVVALLLNGHSIYDVKVGPYLRSSIAILCAAMWVQFALALLRLSVLQGFPSPGVPFWSMAVFAELYIAYKAVFNAQRAN